jgi:hypothetical protein
VLKIDVRKVLGSDNDADPLRLPLEYDADSGSIVFDLGENCDEDSVCSMEGEALVVEGAETITALLEMQGKDYSADADLSVVRKP